MSYDKASRKQLCRWQNKKRQSLSWSQQRSDAVSVSHKNTSQVGADCHSCQPCLVFLFYCPPRSHIIYIQVSVRLVWRPLKEQILMYFFLFFSVWTITFWLTYPPIHFANMTQALFSITRKFDCCHNETRCCNKGSFNQKWTTLSCQRNDKEPHGRLLAVRHVFHFNTNWLLPRVWDVGKPLWISVLCTPLRNTCLRCLRGDINKMYYY